MIFLDDHSAAWMRGVFDEPDVGVHAPADDACEVETGYICLHGRCGL